MELSHLIIFTTTITLLYLIYRYLFVDTNYWKKNGIPYVEGALPFIGNNWPLIRIRESFILLYYTFYKSIGNRSMIGYYNFGTPGLIIRDPELIKTVMLTGFNNFNKNTSSLDPHLDPLLTSDPFFTAGEEWKTNRAILLSALSSKKLKLITLQLRDICKKFSNYIGEQISEEGEYVSVNIHQWMSRFAADLVASAAFGIDGKSFTQDPKTFETNVKQMYQPASIDEFFQIFSFSFPLFAKILRMRFIPKEIDTYFRQLIKYVLKNRKQKEEITNDFLQQVTELCQNKELNEVNENAVTGHATSFFLDAYLTSSVTLSFAAYQIAAHPAVQTKLREEVMNVFEKHNNEMTYECIQDLKYMDQVMNESMRLFPALSYLAKICNKEFKLVGADGLECVVQPGTEVVICTIGLHRDPIFWENPDIFDPERFSDDKKNKRNKFIYLPFGSGPRICVGMRVAMIQMKAAIATLLKNYSITVDPKTEEPIEVHPLSGLFTIPNHKLWLRIKPFN